MAGEQKSPLQRSIEKQLEGSLKIDGKIDADALRKNNPPLSAVLDEFVMSKTTRDDPERFAKDLARTLEARNRKSGLAKALKNLEAQMKTKE